jgi:hypothetical protein
MLSKVLGSAFKFGSSYTRTQTKSRDCDLLAAQAGRIQRFC